MRSVLSNDSTLGVGLCDIPNERPASPPQWDCPFLISVLDNTLSTSRWTRERERHTHTHRQRQTEREHFIEQGNRAPVIQATLSSACCQELFAYMQVMPNSCLYSYLYSRARACLSAPPSCKHPVPIKNAIQHLDAITAVTNAWASSLSAQGVMMMFIPIMAVSGGRLAPVPVCLLSTKLEQR